MPTSNWILITISAALGTIALSALLVVLLRHLYRQRQTKRLSQAKGEFHLRREWLEADFLTIASGSGKPRGLEWADCDFQDEVSFARDRHSGELCALVGISISFEAIEGGGMEDNPNVDNDNAGSAVFRFDGAHWTTDGRALLNLEPDEAIERLHNELETVD